MDQELAHDQSPFDSSFELNLEYLQEVSGGDEEFEQEILATFLESAPDLMDALDRALESLDAPAVRHASHTLKGSSRSIGGQPFSKICEIIETNSKQGLLDQCHVQIPDLKVSFARLQRACRCHIEAGISKAA